MGRRSRRCGSGHFQALARQLTSPAGSWLYARARFERAHPSPRRDEEPVTLGTERPRILSMPAADGPSSPSGGSGFARAVKVIIVSSVMFTFISYWRTAAVVLCDLASTAYYIGGIVENAIGPAAPWFILAVMLFSYAVRMVYIESCSLFVRGGVYRVVRTAMGGV